MQTDPRRNLLQGVLALAFTLGSGLLAAQDDSAGSPLERGRQLLQSGSYAAAAEILQLVAGPDRNEGIVGASRAFFSMGNHAAAVRVCEEAIEGDDHGRFPLIATQLAEVKRATGRSAEALEILQAVLDAQVEAPLRTVVQYGSLLQFSGRRDESLPYLEQALQRYNDGLVFSSEEVAMVALASWLMDSFHDANSLFDEAVRSDPENLEALVLWGELFRQKYNDADASQSYQDALEINGRYTPALVGTGRVTGDERALLRALAINPNSTPALVAYAELLLANDREEEAFGHLERALALNPESLPALAILAARAAMEERMDDYAAYREQVERFSPGNAQFLGAIAETFGNNYRFAEAVEYARAALELDDRYWQGYTLLGSNLVRLGEEEEGQANLEIGFDNDPFNVLSSNMLKVFDTLDTYESRESEHFRVRLSSRDADILWPYLEPLLEESWDTLTAKYGYQPDAPVLIEIFEQSEDFAVRSVGLPDVGPLAGICFGRVVTLVSPDTLSANWQEIVWHEFMHVITLQMTANRIPRWLSEGISVWEEHQGRPYWGRNQDLDLVRAVRQDKLLPVGELNAGFSGARTNADLGFAYFQSYLVVDYMTEQYGFASLRELIDRYALIEDDDARFQQVFGQSLGQFNAGFRRWIDERVAAINVHVHEEDMPDESTGHGHGVRENPSAILAELYNNASLERHMRSRIEENPLDFQAHLQLGIVLFKEENFEEARASLETAYSLLPGYTGYPGPALVLSQIHEREGNREGQLRWLEILLDNLQHDYDSAMILAEAALDGGDHERAAYYIDRAMQVDPYRLGVHRLKARYAGDIGDTQLAVTEYEVLAKLEISDPVEVQTDLAEAYLRNGQAADARQSVLYALELAPSYERAQRLLLQAVDGGGN